MKIPVVQDTAGNATTKYYEWEIMSLEQIVGGHLRLETPVKRKLKKMATSSEKYDFRDNLTVLSPNATDISRAPWTLIIGEKNERKKLGLLLIGNRLFGITPLAIGLKMQKTAAAHGKSKMIKYLKDLVTSIVEKPEKWHKITSYTTKPETK